MRAGTTKKTLKTVQNSTAIKRKAKIGKTTQEKQKQRSVPRFYEIKIHITAEEYARGLPYFANQKNLPKFLLDSFREKINRAEANDKKIAQARLRNDAKILEPLLHELYQQGKLNFLFDSLGREREDEHA